VSPWLRRATSLFAAVAAAVLPRQVHSGSSDASSGANAFAVDLYKALRDRPGNLAVSPASVELALTLAFVGAKGATAEEMGRALHLPVDDAIARARELMARLDDPARTAYTLRVANRLFAEESYALEKPYLERVASLGAPLEAVDFRRGAEPARQRINSWVAEQTADRIRDLLPRGAVDTETRLVLANAIYLLADWRSSFARESTRPETFHLTATEDASAPTMLQVATFPYLSADGVALLEMPYAGDDLSMVIVLPDRVDGLATVERGLDAGRLESWIARMRDERVVVLLPRFTIDPPEPLALTQALQVLGVKLAFDRDRADFTGIANPSDPADRLFVNEVFHKAFVKVDEKGTEAAAATAVVVIGASSARPAEQPKEFRADHPFLFAVRDRKTGAFLFLGRVVRPAE
jgi:serine protease inhibitor